MFELDSMQARVLGCLIEKQATTPDQYPLTVNALRNACNQKTNRHPVLDLSEGQVGHALRQLESEGLVKQAWSTRAARWEHRFGDHYHLYSKQTAILATLMLRGPQTAAEIRAHCARLHSFDDVDDVEFELDRLAEKEEPMVMVVPRQPGQKGQRYAHLMCGQPDADDLMVAVRSASSGEGSVAEDLVARVEQLEAQMAELLEKLDTAD